MKQYPKSLQFDCRMRKNRLYPHLNLRRGRKLINRIKQEQMNKKTLLDAIKKPTQDD